MCFLIFRGVFISCHSVWHIGRPGNFKFDISPPKGITNMFGTCLNDDDKKTKIHICEDVHCFLWEI